MKTAKEKNDILDELTSIEYDDENDALTLLDDEEASFANGQDDDDDLEAFYMGEDTKEEVHEEVVPEPVVEPKKEEVKEEIKLDPIPEPQINGGYQGQLEKLSTNIDRYLNTMNNKKQDEVKVEKIAPVAPVVEPKVEEPKKEEVPVKKVERKPVTGVEMNNLNQLFEKVTDNVKGASDIVNRNAEIKRKIDERFIELKKLQEEHEKNKQSDYAEINAYKDEVYEKLKLKKSEVETDMANLKAERDKYEKEKAEYEKEKEAFIKEKTETLAMLEDKKKSIEQIEQGLAKRKQELDQEKEAITRDRTQVDIEKKELADNLVKFNKLVDEFTLGVDRFSETN